MHVDVRHGEYLPVHQFLVSRQVPVGHGPQRLVIRVQIHRRVHQPGKLGRLSDVVVVPMGADDRDDRTPVDGIRDRPLRRGPRR